MEDQNIDQLKEVFATKEDLHRELRVLYSDLSDKIDRLSENTNNKIDSKINKIYWVILGQTAIMVGIILAILRTANVF